MARKWTVADIPPQVGKTALVTGANRGLGLEIAGALAASGARVVMACRDIAKGEGAAASIRRNAPRGEIEVMNLDIADLGSIRRFAEAFARRFPEIDLLVNNASAILVPQGKTADGFETHFGTNVLGTFALTGLLLDRLRAAPAARIVNTTSNAHRMTKGLDFDDLHFARTAYKPMEAYARSKLATLIFTFELDRRLRKAGQRVIAVAAHPGYSNTNPDKGGFALRVATALIAQPAQMGALPALYAATAADVESGAHYGPGGVAELRGYPAKVGCAATARDAGTAARLWAVAEEATGVRYLDG
ncbi:MAG TPA: oxidoreductase [Alphaproteobacteria bacterium]|nr:oxidoreductase [Alphaproteobacteria bacterium]